MLPNLPSPLRCLFWALALVLLPAGWVAWALVPLGPGEIGVRQQDWTGEIEPRDLSVGLHLIWPGVHTLHRIDGRAQTLRFGPTGTSTGPFELPPIEVRTRDDNVARFSALVLWRVRPGRAHELVRSGLQRAHGERLIAAAQDVLRAEFGRMSSEDWFDPERRAERTAAARPRLEAEFAALELELLELFVPGAAFSSEYEQRLQAGQSRAQERLLEEARHLVAVERRALERAEAETTALEREARAQWSLERARIATEGAARRQAVTEAALDRVAAEERAAQAAWDLLVGGAERALADSRAEGERRRLAALGDAGGRVLLAREAARALNFERIHLDSADPRVPVPFDLDRFVALLLGENP